VTHSPEVSAQFERVEELEQINSAAAAHAGSASTPP
jgi:hypothetical protein